MTRNSLMIFNDAMKSTLIRPMMDRARSRIADVFVMRALLFPVKPNDTTTSY